MTSISRTRRVLAVVAVTTALCADQAIKAAPFSPAQTGGFAEIASRLVGRLARSLCQAMPAMLQAPARQRVGPSPKAIAAPVCIDCLPAHQPTSPFQFRLPPPLI